MSEVDVIDQVSNNKRMEVNGTEVKQQILYYFNIT